MSKTALVIPKRLAYLQNRFGVENTVNVLEFLAKTGKAVRASLADDDKITASDMLNFISPITAIPSAISSLPKVPLELEDELTDEEQAQLLTVVISSGVIPEQSQEAVKDGVKLAEDFKRFIIKYFVRD